MARIIAGAVAAAAAVSLAPSFVPSIVGSSPAAAPALRGGAQPSSSTSTGNFAAASVATVAVAAVAAGVRRRQAKVAQNGARRDLAVAYEESGIELFDNGKFAQGLVGADGAWGRYEYDPAGLSQWTEFVPYFREAELKHGRVAMLATVGWIATDMGMRVPGEPFQVSTIEAHDAMVKFGAMPQMLVWLGLLEVFGFLAFNNAAEGRTDRAPGDFGLRMLYPTDAAGQYSMQLKELRNGRLAMLAFGGIATAAVLTGKTWPFLDATADKREAPAFGAGSALCGGLQAPKTQRGSGVAAQAMERSYGLPFLPKPANLGGYVGGEAEFDPLGFSDTFDMKWLRESELKHGRVCMLACVGFYSQQYITFPGFTPTENALDSVYTADPAGMAALLFLSGYIESASYGGKLTMLDMFEGNREPGYHFQFGAGFLKGKSDKDVEVMKVKELTNGRLAMLAFSGMVHHNLVVKGPLFPLFPDGWTGPQGSWELDSVFGRLNTVGAASTWGV
uniref:Chlorophyll a-b binding protein, chloroplastic n=1 Tax=Strombidinopsis acuminata TaxID=141414 RepID=A0A7S3T2S7_9SPIT|mmetsp:Transcript_50935/g.69970  ORF Transcript_50935/g.69970 Transcript_50935/m.69970 type:complete len:504 (+) Transcript_50935:67-1578(+)